MKKILLRADDLGYSEGVNCGIAKSVRDGLIRSVGIMTNMPSAEHGVRLLAGQDVCFGQHTNICNGYPLTDPKRIPSITQENGEFKSSKAYRSAGEDFVVLEEVILEIEAQYLRFKELTGRKPSYFEGHAVSSANFFKGLEIVAKRHGLKYSGLSLDGSPIHVGDTDVYMWMESMLSNYDPEATVKKMVEQAHEGACDMMVCHPGYLDDYVLEHSSLTVPRTKEVAMLCDPEIRRWLENQGVLFVTYDDL